MLPEAFLTRIKTQLGEEYDAFLHSLERPRAVALRFNPLKGARPALPFEGEAVPWEAQGVYYDPAARPGLHPYHEAGVYYLQEASAMSAVSLLDPQPGERVCDLCAAPGGKTTQIAGRMQGEGFLLCNEYSPKRAKILSQNIERMGVANALVTNETTEKLATMLPGFFDRVLIDAPCSGEGMFRKGEVAITEWSPEATVACADRQREILDNAAKMVAGGGYLLYSTCTYNSKENEEQVDGFLERHPDFSLIPVSDSVLSSSTPGILFDGALHEELYLCRRFYPHISDGEGQFVALMKREDKGKTPVGKADKKREKKPEQIPPTVLDFLRDNLTAIPDGNIKMHGENAVLHTHDIPLPSHGVFLSGILLGEVKGKNLFPSYQLFSALGHLFKRRIELSKEDAIRYLKGEELECSIPEMRGFATICYLGVTLGGGKISDGRIKNHYPKGLRLLG